ncbi:MAG: bifunctional DNA-formamidopyrimidine glycosylase/DNA-(apurinic or apyrimidinic site) lyase [Gammaproteobacteria bacterium]|nr:bifunctional DNA-formamidopyrimidine glycosylase/DNA-(apurinic or apyrimidinic site) lyase [Gammaproteobacteria bacterium]
MPELPEVETTRRGIAPFVLDQTIAQLVVRQPALRWPIPPELPGLVRGQRVTALERRGKYLLLRLDAGTLIVHLGMSGSLRVGDPRQSPRKHDHFDLVFAPALALRFHDPRRFGCLLWTDGDPLQHPLLVGLGVEPFAPEFTGRHLYRGTRGRSAPVKIYLMDHTLVVGVGNIYASESLFRAGIDPRRAADRVSEARYERLAGSVREVLEAALAAGGTTLRDFVNERGSPGYFKQTLAVYGRTGESCRVCNAPIRTVRTGQRSTFFCPRCQR